MRTRRWTHISRATEKNNFLLATITATGHRSPVAGASKTRTSCSSGADLIAQALFTVQDQRQGDVFLPSPISGSGFGVVIRVVVWLKKCHVLARGRRIGSRQPCRYEFSVTRRPKGRGEFPYPRRETGDRGVSGGPAKKKNKKNLLA